jgi:predicted RecA/RadA family phage recombinase
MKNFIAIGAMLQITAGAAYSYGDGVVAGGIFGVATGDIANGAEGTIALTGVYSLPKVGSQAWTVGARVYWDAANDRCTTTGAGGLLFIGTAVSAVGSGAGETAGNVRLNGTSLPRAAFVADASAGSAAEINALRQVDSSQVVSSLRERGLIYPSGTRKEVGHPVEYRTTDKFLEVFGLGELQDLPKLRSLQLTLDDEQRIQQALEGLKDPEGQDNPVPEDLALL